MDKIRFRKKCVIVQQLKFNPILHLITYYCNRTEYIYNREIVFHKRLLYPFKIIQKTHYEKKTTERNKFKH